MHGWYISLYIRRHVGQTRYQGPSRAKCWVWTAYPKPFHMKFHYILQVRFNKSNRISKSGWPADWNRDLLIGGAASCPLDQPSYGTKMKILFRTTCFYFFVNFVSFYDYFFYEHDSRFLYHITLEGNEKDSC